VIENSRIVARRRALLLRGLAAAAAAGLVAGVVSGAGAGDAGDAGEPTPAPARTAVTATATVTPRVSAEPIERAAGRLIVLRYAGAAVPGYVRRALREGRAGGAILFADNLGGPGDLRRATTVLHRAAGGQALICTDQEGGKVRVVGGIGPERSQAAQLSAGSVRADARAAGTALRQAGINVTLAPVADVAVSGGALAGRAFSSDVEAASAAMADSVTGWREGGVAPTAKHFPGLGGSATNTDDAPATVDDDEATLRSRDLPPFAAAIQAGVPLVMTSHARYPALDPERIASQSRPIITGLLREELGFDGVVITDSMEAAAVLAESSLEEAVERSIEAGTDVILTTGRGSSIRVYRALVKRARRDRAFADLIRRAAGRVSALTDSLGGG